MVALPYPSTRKGSSGGGTSGPIRVHRTNYLVDPDNGRDYLEYTSSWAISPAEILETLQAIDPTIGREDVMLDLFVVGGGGNGGSGAGSFGGFPGMVAFTTVQLSAIAEDSMIAIEIGAGGLGNADGYYDFGTETSIVELDWQGYIVDANSVTASGALSANPASLPQNLGRYVEYGVMLSDPALVSADSPIPNRFGAGSANGPGCGGRLSSLDYMTINGGLASRNSRDAFTACGMGGRSTNDPDVVNGLPVTGFPGFSPGGGGGAAVAGAAGGDGAGGVARIRPWTLERS